MAVKKLISPQELLYAYPIDMDTQNTIIQFQNLGKDLLENKNDKIVCILGPCSIHHPDSILEYAEKLKTLEKQVADRIHIVLRAYVEKPRSTVGWKGFLYDPYVSGKEDLERGLEESRKLFVKLAGMSIALSMEFVNPLIFPYFSDLISWGFIGARTCSSQAHRELSSGASFPIGFKNSIDGNVFSAIGGMLSAKSAHKFYSVNQQGEIAEVQTSGNHHTHIVLRGSDCNINYTKSHVEKAFMQQKVHGLYTKILVDCSHGNSSKDYKKTEKILDEFIPRLSSKTEPLLGVMVESFLEEGKQALPISKNKSITDACIGFSKTKAFIENLYESLEKRSILHPPKVYALSGQ